MDIRDTAGVTCNVAAIFLANSPFLPLFLDSLQHIQLFGCGLILFVIGVLRVLVNDPMDLESV